MVDASPRYRRADGIVHRSVEGVVLVVAPDGQAQDLEGGAAIVFQVLEVPSSASEVQSTVDDLVGGQGPGLDAIQEAIDLLVTSGLVTPVG